MSVRDRIRFCFSLFVLCVFAYGAFEAADFSRRARYMPLYVSVAGMALSFLLVFLEIWRMRAGSGGGRRRGAVAIEDVAAEDIFSPEEEWHRLKTTSYYMLWMIGYVGLIGILGLPVASAMFLGWFLWLEAAMKLRSIAFCIGALLVCLFALTHLMHLRWPSSLVGW